MYKIIKKILRKVVFYKSFIYNIKCMKNIKKILSLFTVINIKGNNIYGMEKEKSKINTYYEISKNFFKIKDDLQKSIDDEKVYNELFVTPYEFKREITNREFQTGIFYLPTSTVSKDLMIITLREHMEKIENKNYYNGLIQKAAEVIKKLKKKVKLEKGTLLEIVKNIYININNLNKINFTETNNYIKNNIKSIELKKEKNISDIFQGNEDKNDIFYTCNYGNLSIGLIDDLNTIIGFFNEMEDFTINEYKINLINVINCIFAYKNSNDLEGVIYNPEKVSSKFINETYKEDNITKEKYIKKINNFIEKESISNIQRINNFISKK